MDLMTVEDVPFVFGVFVAPLIVVAVFATVVATEQPRRAVATASVLSAMIVGSLATYWYLWGVAFDDLDAGREVSSSVDLVSNLAIGLSAVSASGLLALSAALVVSKSRKRSSFVTAR